MTRRFIISTSLAVLLAWLTLSLSSCGGESNDTPTPEPTLAPMKLYISVPQANSGEGTRVGDPGEDASETEDWDQLTVIIAYTQKTTGAGIVDNDPQKMVYYDTFTKDEFDGKTTVKHPFSELGPDDGTGLHTYTMYLPLGTIRVYGVTYSKDSNGNGMAFEGTSKNLEALLNEISEDGQDHTLDIENLKITNDYARTSAGMDLNKFLSVATGYATKVNINETATNERDMEISKSSSDVEDRYWRMPLSRLATKLDIQWDAKGAYAANSSGKITYTDVTVEGFTYDGGDSSLGENESGYGRLFPTLSNTDPVGGKKIFLNTAAISKRNGRVYHYLFPDRSTSPKVTFNLTTTTEGASTPQTQTYDLKFSSSLQPAAWYKVNVTINGQSTSKSVVIDQFNTGN